jgi:hypothetical protein
VGKFVHLCRVYQIYSNSHVLGMGNRWDEVSNDLGDDIHVARFGIFTLLGSGDEERVREIEGRDTPMNLGWGRLPPVVLGPHNEPKCCEVWCGRKSR